MSSSAPKDQKPRLTFGVEFEFSLAHKAAGKDDLYPKDSRSITFLQDGLAKYQKERFVFAHIHDTLNNAGFKTTTQYIEEEKYVDYLTDPEDPTIESQNFWTVKHDNTVLPPDSAKDNYDWYDVEITSPILAYNAENIKLVRNVCKLLTRTYRISCNETCGLHVHVGNGLAGFDLATLRNLMGFIWAFEPQLGAIHPERRVKDTIHCASLHDKAITKAGTTYLKAAIAEEKRLTGEGKTSGDPKIRSQLEAILWANSINDIVDMMRSDDKKLA